MKKTKTIIPLKLREEMATDPFYSTCSVYNQHGHICEGSITWEHAMIFGGKKIQEKWAIIPLCEKAHAVNSFQDAGTMHKDINQWVALNMATDEDLKKFTNPDIAFNKVDYFRERRYLNDLYGSYVHQTPKPIPNVESAKDSPVSGIQPVYIVLPDAIVTAIKESIDKMALCGFPKEDTNKFIAEAIQSRIIAIETTLALNAVFRKNQSFPPIV